MTTLLTAETDICAAEALTGLGEAQLAAAEFLARHSGRTLEAYRADIESR